MATTSKNQLKLVRAVFDPSKVSGDRTIAAHGLGVFIPAKAIIIRAFYDVVTTFTSATDAGTIAIHAVGADDIVAALAISDGRNMWDAGNHHCIPGSYATANDAAEDTAIEMAALVAGSFISVSTSAVELTATVAVEALTAGKLNLYVEYVVSE